MKNYRPLMLQKIDGCLPGIRVHQLRMNRHLPEVDLLVEHAHSFTQILCYLSGVGLMTVDGETYSVGPASVFFLPPHCTHSFLETSGRRPLCLVLDLDWRGAIKHGASSAQLSHSARGAIKQELAKLTKLAEPNQASCRLIMAAGVFYILDILLRATGGLPSLPRETPPFVRQFERLLHQSDTPLPEVALLSRSMGYQPDYLNRIFKQATGQTLREYRDALFLRKVLRLLKEQRLIKEVCETLGFLDQNYFARWFKKQTGLPPSVYANKNRCTRMASERLRKEPRVISAAGEPEFHGSPKACAG